MRDYIFLPVGVRRFLRASLKHSHFTYTNEIAALATIGHDAPLEDLVKLDILSLLFAPTASIEFSEDVFNVKD